MARAGFWHSRRDAQVIPLYFRVIGRPEREDSTGLLHELTSQRMTNKLRLDLPGTLDDDVGCRRFSLVHHHIASIPAGVVLRVSLSATASLRRCNSRADGENISNDYWLIAR